jgi:hypothetical protein
MYKSDHMPRQFTGGAEQITRNLSGAQTEIVSEYLSRTSLQRCVSFARGDCQSGENFLQYKITA